MILKLLADEDLNHRIVIGLRRREPGLDILAAGSTNLRGSPDSEVLDYCANSGRILVSHDFKTMPAHFYRFVQGADSPGLVLVPQYLDIGAAINEILAVLRHHEEDRLRNQILYLPL